MSERSDPPRWSCQRQNGDVKDRMTEREAKRLAANKIKWGAPESLTAYHCPVCDFWHIGKRKEAAL